MVPICTTRLLPVHGMEFPEMISENSTVSRLMGCGSSSPEAAAVTPVAASPAKPASSTPAAVAVAAPKEEPKAPSAPPAPVEPAPAADVAPAPPAEAPDQPEMAAPAEVMEGANAPGDEKLEEKAEPADEPPTEVRTVVDATHGYLDHAAFEQGHTIIAEKIARDKVQFLSLSCPPMRDASRLNP